uniref:Uncharacterized protein n=1 Tax=Cyclamen persicum x Cyclamen purpurascens TaxID=993404 RepID=G1UH83_9ERIC|nr:hypothetical protein [Cyclamen persicum x Cyclamen purpurascens]
MAEKPTLIIRPNKGVLQSEALYDYIVETSVYPRESKFLKENRDVTASHPWSGMSSNPDAAQLMGILLKLANAKKTIEVGVFTGYSLLLTALTIPNDGKILAIDPDQEAYDLGLPVIKRTGVEHKINFVAEAALPVLDKLLIDPENEGSFDFAFVDADKENYLNYHERLLKLVKLGGVIVYDNTLWFGTVALPEDSVKEGWRHGRKTALEVNKALTSDPRIQLAHVPVGDGNVICIRIQ